MLGYRHAYHAGNDADVIKHVSLCVLLTLMTRKEKPFLYLETHGGAGGYDLTALDPSDPVHPAEFTSGIGVLWPDRPPAGPVRAEPAQAEPDPDAFGADAVERYLSLVGRFNPGPELTHYPGSPWFAQQYLRPGDRAVIAELHPADHPRLAARLRADARFRVEHQDGYDLLRSALPPVEKRGLTLIDPAYERRDEVRRLKSGLQEALKRFRHGVYAIWYPLGGKHAAEDIVRTLRGLDVSKSFDLRWQRALGHRRRDGSAGLEGCGLVVLNPPFGAAERLLAAAEHAARLLEALPRAYAAGRVSLTWLVAESGARARPTRR